MSRLAHGGRLRAAALHYGRPVEEWVDLSTGINPHAYPLPPIPASCWQRLPEDEDPLAATAARYYGCPNLWPVAGSQAAIQALPGVIEALLPGSTPRQVAVLTPAYAEHAAAWATAGWTLHPCNADEITASKAPVIQLCNPNNPTSVGFSVETLVQVAERQAARGGYLIIDEAFIDATPDASLAPRLDQHPALIILRSLGKFFGLAGARVGFVLAAPAIGTALQERLGPWSVAGPSRHAACCALADLDWQDATRAALHQASARLAALLAPLGPSHGTALFRWLPHPDAAALSTFFAERGLLLRHFATPAAVRFGLPGNEADWQRLATALTDWSQR